MKGDLITHVHKELRTEGKTGWRETDRRDIAGIQGQGDVGLRETVAMRSVRFKIQRYPGHDEYLEEGWGQR